MVTWGRSPPPGYTWSPPPLVRPGHPPPPGQTWSPTGTAVNGRAVRIILECILVENVSADVACKCSFHFCFTCDSGGFIISAFTYNIYVLFVTFGIMCGTAQSLLYVGGASILYYYFDEKKGLGTSKDPLW